MADIWNNISPFDYRYRVPELEPYFSEAAHVRYLARVEAALARVMAERGICSREAAEEIARAAERVSPEEVHAKEQKTRHDIRALVNVIRSHVSDGAKPWVHWGVTSYDIRDTAHALRMRDGIQEAVLPALVRLEEALIAVAEREKGTVQIGRTHGQHAVPVTVGFAFAEYVERLGQSIVQIQKSAQELRGKCSGAVGAYNSLSLLVDDPFSFERDVLAHLGLEPARYATQIVPPEPVVHVLHAAVSAFGVIANCARDMRSLQRSEIAEVHEEFRAEQVGSSTMPHKRNPVTFENIESMWKVCVPKMVTVYLDQVSEHQRDLTNSASQRFQFEILAGLMYAGKRMEQALSRLQVDRTALAENIARSRDMVIAEPLYLLLAQAGHPDAHETVKQLTLQAHKEGRRLLEVAQRELGQYWERISPEKRSMLDDPAQYIGKAKERTEEVCRRWRERMHTLPGSGFQE